MHFIKIHSLTFSCLMEISANFHLIFQVKVTTMGPTFFFCNFITFQLNQTLELNVFQLLSYMKHFHLSTFTTKQGLINYTMQVNPLCDLFETYLFNFRNCIMFVFFNNYKENNYQNTHCTNYLPIYFFLSRELPSPKSTSHCILFFFLV